MAYTPSSFDQLPDDALVRIAQLAHNPRRRTPGPVLLNVGEATLYRMVRAGLFPAPIKIGRIAAWRLGDVRAWLAARVAAPAAGGAE